MRQRGFSLVELIGVLAILVILTALLLPKLSRKRHQPTVAETVNEAQLLEVIVALQSLQAALNSHLAQFGSLGSQSGTTLNLDQAYDDFGQVLLREGLIERPFAVRLSTNAKVRLVRAAALSAASPVQVGNGAYDLDGDGRNDVVGAAFVVEAVLPDLKEVAARALNDRLDGPRLGAETGDDLLGRVIYHKAGPDERTEVHIYILRGR